MKDDALSVLVSLINDSQDGAYGITLTVGGTVVTGTLIPNTTWMREVAELHPLGPDGNEGIRVLFSTFREDLEKVRADEESLREAQDRGLPEHMVAAAQATHSTEFIHLKRVWFMGQAQPGNLERSYWRGRLEEVTGWAPGILVPQSEGD